MNKTGITLQDDGRYLVEGELNANTVPDLWRTASGLIQVASDSLLFDLQGVVRSDSAGLALLIEWMRQAKAKNLQILFRNLPAQMWEIAKVSDLDHVIPLAK